MKKLFSLLLALMVLACAGCGKEEIPEVTEETLPAEEPVTVPNPLTGEPLTDNDAVNDRPVAVMLNNIKDAMPQCGVSQADMIFEFNVEGGITRMVGFFQEIAHADTIGSVRSARPCFVETVLGMDAIYAHCGGSTEAMQMIGNLGIPDINAAGGVFWRDEDRAKTMDYEHTLMTSGQKLSEYIAQSGWRTEHEADYSYPITYTEDATPTGGSDANHVAVCFSGYKTGIFDYDPATKLYKVGQYDAPYIDGNTGVQVGVTNLLVLRTTVYNSGDDSGHMVIDLQGSGSGQFFCGGKVVDITWQKEEMSAPFTYCLTDGTPLSLGIGHSYVCVIGNDANVTIS